MKKIALLISDNLLPSAENARPDRFELVEEVGKLAPALAAEGMELIEVRWREIADRAAEFDAILPLMVWDYFEGNEDAFLSAIAKAEAVTPVFNTFDILKWNSDKSYLEELEARGAPVIRTLTVDGVTKTNVARAFETLDTDTLVIKPTVGGGAWRQVLYKKADPFPAASDLPPEGALMQAFLPSVLEEGEYSFLYFGGRFSHAARKTPKSGDYRIQSIYGGAEETYTPSSAERDTASDILDVLDFTPLYARVDLLRGRDGTLKLIELELIEPYLYLPHAKGEAGENEGAQKFAAALKSRLERSAKTKNQSA
jgi:glutathione synthase/RimK-type ligase-like ATP-grasp enzyme